jgi:hypothetical protein
MLMDRYKISYKIGQPISLKFQLKQGDIDFIDYKESNDNQLNGTKESSINEIERGEVVRYKPDSISTTITATFAGVSSYISAGFNSEEILKMADAYKKSTYIFQVYDSVDPLSQLLLHTSYLNGYSILTSGGTSIHSVYLSNEAFNIYLPESFLKNIDSTSFNLYFKVFFYSAKTGELFLFTQNVASLVNESQQYFSFPFNKNARTYTFPLTITFKKLPDSEYTNIAKKTVESINLQKPNYPVGNIFNTDGTYTTI